MFTNDHDKFVEEIQSRDNVFYQCVEIINEKISRILWASKTLLGYSDDFYKIKTEVNFNYINFRSTYSILSAIFVIDLIDCHFLKMMKQKSKIHGRIG